MQSFISYSVFGHWCIGGLAWLGALLKCTIVQNCQKGNQTRYSFHLRNCIQFTQPLFVALLRLPSYFWITAEDFNVLFYT